jgi:superfamily II DNA or RNA helicase
MRPPFAKPVRNDLKKVEGKKASLFYVVDAPATLNQNAVVVTLARRQRRPGSERAVLRPWWPSNTPGGWRPEPEDRVLMALLDDAQLVPSTSTTGTVPIVANTPAATPTATPRRFVLRPEMQAQMVERLCRTGRCRLKRADDEEDPPALRWDDGRPWRFVIDARCADPSAKRWNWRGCLRREEDRMDLAEPLVLLPGLVVQGVGRAARFDDAGIFAWMLRLRHEKEMSLAEQQQDTMLGRILGESRYPPGELVEGLKLDEVDLPPTPCLTIRSPRQNWGSDNLIAELEFDYDGARVSSFPPGRMAVQTAQKRAIRRDVRAETKAKERLEDLGFREAKDYRVEPGTMEIAPKRVPGATRDLVLESWRVEAEGILYRTAGEFKLNVSTGIDWFELSGQVDFGSQKLTLPEVLAAARRGETMIALDDGSMGMLPEDWLKKYGLLADLGTAGEGEELRFGRAQAGLLDALLAAQPGSKCDTAFGKVRKELHAFEGIEPLEAPPNFVGELRPYQQEGLGWLDYLRKFEFGGILADDMGLGKTVQVLALLQRRKTKRQAKGPSLIVVPRSLVFNWLQESAKFTPKLKVLDYTGPGRHASRELFPKYDLIVTTYGTLRSDVVELSEMTFDYAILDEAQAIKNAESQAAKAARLLKAKHRLAMSGTPIENHLGELWSIFEFLNPGMLGTATVFKKNAGGVSGQDEGGRQLLAKALRPFILRRTKREVVKDLPDKVELTLSCDLEPAQRKLYEDLRTHYRSALLRSDTKAVTGSKIEVLEALLRLRQAACHPGLIDPSRIDDASAKLDMLLPQLAEVVEEGHKVLVFSQFTSFLAIVKKRLDAEGLKYEYLDGQTRDRQERVENFQTNPDIPIFLISLKAGGLGLNLTAAEYVYLLDPWWNPAVEAQAIDRSHRIGQTRNVFAYRLIARDTVEQKILDLQQKKRDLADAILNADNRVIQSLTRDDLEFLLS